MHRFHFASLQIVSVETFLFFIRLCNPCNQLCVYDARHDQQRPPLNHIFDTLWSTRSIIYGNFVHWTRTNDEAIDVTLEPKFTTSSHGHGYVDEAEAKGGSTHSLRDDSSTALQQIHLNALYPKIHKQQNPPNCS